MKKVKICIGSACYLKGSYKIIEIFKSKIKEYNLEDKVEINAAFCLGECTKAVSVKIDEQPVISVLPDNANEVFEKYILGT